MIIIADAHLGENLGNSVDFFRMLAALEKTDQDVVFLGDIFDLWIALPRYEDNNHKRFLSWCHRQKQHRTVGFIEGNREYCLAACKSGYFSWCSDGPYYAEAHRLLFCHGDQVNWRDKNYQRFRKFAKHPATRWLMRWLPFGPRIADWIRVHSKQTNLSFRRALPKEEIQVFADAHFDEGARKIFVGHFHQAYCYRNPEGKTLHTVPGWLETGSVTLFDPVRHEVKHLNWQDLMHRPFQG
jgi:UDP-2,3-diacylglucosamine pyrophosphatase LpxH